MLSVLLSGIAVRAAHAQDDAPIFSWPGDVQVSTSTLTIREGERLSYQVRLSEQPLADGWWLRIHVDGVVYIDGALDEKGIRWVPSVGWEFNQDASSGPTQWRSIHITALQDDDDEDELVTFTHEMWTRTRIVPRTCTAWPPLPCGSSTTTAVMSSATHRICRLVTRR